MSKHIARCEATMTDQIIGTFFEGGYSYKTRNIYIRFLRHLEGDLPFKLLVFELNHEETHRILHKLMGRAATEQLDHNMIETELDIGFNTKQELADLAKKGRYSHILRYLEGGR